MVSKWRAAITWLVAISVSLLLPLSPLTVYAQQDDGETAEDVGEFVIETAPGTPPDLIPLNQLVTATPASVSDRLANENHTVLAGDIGYFDPVYGLAYFADEWLIYEQLYSDQGDYLVVANLREEVGRDVSQSPLIATNSRLQQELGSAFTGDSVRLSLNEYDLRALTGELPGDVNGDGVCDEADGWSADDDRLNIFDNDFCDPPRVDVRVIALLDYLLRDRQEGGAGREYIEVKRIISANHNNDEQRSPREGEEVEDPEGVGRENPHYVDLTTTNSSQRNFVSQAVDIGAIDRIRVTTRIRRTGLFSSKNDYRYQAPIPIQVAWQSDEGQERVPLPTISIHELLKDLPIEELINYLDFGAILEEPDFAGRTLQSLGIQDLAQFLGARLLQPLLDGQDISNFSFEDTIRDFGVLALAGSLNLNPEVIRRAGSLAELEELQGRSFVASQMGLDEFIEGNTPTELYQGVARAYLATQLNVVPHVLTGHSGPDDFVVKLGQGRLEAVLPVAEHSFDGATLDDVRRAMNRRFDVVFRDIGTSIGRANAAQIDERLGLTYGSTFSFLKGDMSATDYKRRVGESVWNNDIYLYREGDYAPQHPARFAESLVASQRGPTAGSLVSFFSEVDDILATLPSSSPARAHLLTLRSTLTAPLDNLISQIRVEVAALPRLNEAARAAWLPSVNSHLSALANIQADLGRGAANLSGYADQTVRPAGAQQADDAGWATVHSYLNQQSALLDQSIAALRQYAGNNQDSDGTSQRRDQMWGLPGGTWYALIGGRGNETAYNNALTAAGIAVVSQKFPASQSEQLAFTAAAERVVAGRDAAFTTTSSANDTLADVFLSPSPRQEFRRLGRGQLLNNLRDSAQAESLGINEAITTLTFYTDRYEIIRGSLQIIRDELTALNGSLPADLQAALTGLDRTFSVGVSEATVSGVQGLVRQNRGQLYSVLNVAETHPSFSSVDRLIRAARSLERAVMEIAAGEETVYRGALPASAAADIDLSNEIDEIFGNDRLVASAAFEGLAGAASGNLEINSILVRLGMRKLSTLLELPSEALVIYRNFYERGEGSTDNFFAAVGAARSDGRYDINDATREQLAAAGRDYLGRVSLPALARRLNIKLPDWLTPNDLANLMTGDPTRIAVGLGGTQLERELNLPSGFVNSVVYPEGETEEERRATRETAIIEATLGRFGIELDIPRNFSLTNNPLTGLGRSRLETILGVERGTITGTPLEIAARLSQPANTDRANDQALARSYERFLTIFGIRLSSEALTLRNQLSSFSPDTDEFLAALPAYVNALREHVNAALTGQPLPGSDAAARQQSYLTRLHYLDNRLGVDSTGPDNKGTTQRWLEGYLTTEEYIRATGTRSAELLGSDLVLKGLERLGIKGPIFEALKDNRQQLVNLFRQESWSGSDFATVYGIVSSAFSFNLDEKLNFEEGTMAAVIANPSIAPELLIDQGIRHFGSQLLGVDLNDTTNDGSEIQRVLERALIGGVYDRDSGTFQPFNGIDGDQAVLAAVDELGEIAFDELQALLPDNIRPFMQIPLTVTRNALQGNLRERGLVSGYVQYATVAERSLRLARAEPNPSTKAAEEQRVLTLVKTERGTPLATTESSIHYAGFAQLNGRNELAIAEQNVGVETAAELDQQIDNDQKEIDEPLEAATDYPLTNLEKEAIGKLEKVPADVGTALMSAGGGSELRKQQSRLVTASQTELLAKEFGFGLTDFALNQILGPGVITPGLARTLYGSSPEQRTVGILYVATNWMNVRHGAAVRAALGDFSFLAQYSSIAELHNLFRTAALGQGETALGQLLSGNIMQSIQNQFMSDGIWDDLDIQPGTLGALTAFVVNGHGNDANIGGVEIKGIKSLYSSEWMISTGLGFAEKWLGLERGTLTNGFQLAATVYKFASQTMRLAQTAPNSQEYVRSQQGLVNAGVNLGVYLAEQLLGEQLATFEAALGLPSGTLTGMVRAVVKLFTGDILGAALELVMIVYNLIFGFSRVRVETKATADGYYPYVGQLGQFAPPNDEQSGNVPHLQWPSTDLYDRNNQLDSSRALGEFDPTDEISRGADFKKAAQAKVKGLIVDLFSITSRATTTGTLPEGGCDEDGCTTDRIIPTAVIVHDISGQQEGESLYTSDPEMQHLTRQYRPNRLNSDDPEFADAKWGLWARPEFWDVVHIGY